MWVPPTWATSLLRPPMRSMSPMPHSPKLMISMLNITNRMMKRAYLRKLFTGTGRRNDGAHAYHPPPLQATLHPTTALALKSEEIMARTRRPLIAGNWKMNGLRTDGLALAKGVADSVKQAKWSDREVLICPPA